MGISSVLHKFPIGPEFGGRSSYKTRSVNLIRLRYLDWCQRVPENTALPRSLRNAAPGEALEVCTVLTTQAHEAFASWLDGDHLPLVSLPARCLQRPANAGGNSTTADTVS